MAQFYFTGAHLEFLESRGLIISRMRQIYIKDKLKILQNTIKLDCIPNISWFYFYPKNKPEFKSTLRRVHFLFASNFW